MAATSTSERRARARLRPRHGNVVAFPGTMSRATLRAGVEFKWHCPLHGCYRSGRWVKQFATAARGLHRHVEECHR